MMFINRQITASPFDTMPKDEVTTNRVANIDLHHDFAS